MIEKWKIIDAHLELTNWEWPTAEIIVRNEKGETFYYLMRLDDMGDLQFYKTEQSVFDYLLYEEFDTDADEDADDVADEGINEGTPANTSATETETKDDSKAPLHFTCMDDLTSYLKGHIVEYCFLDEYFEELGREAPTDTETWIARCLLYLVLECDDYPEKRGPFLYRLIGKKTGAFKPPISEQEKDYWKARKAEEDE